MYFPVGWPKVLDVPELGQTKIKHITSNRDKILFAILTDDALALWFCKPCVQIDFRRRTPQSIQDFGINVIVEWKPDSSMLVIVTSEGHLLFYNVSVNADQKGVYVLKDSPHANLRRDSAELFIKEVIPALSLTLNKEVSVWDGAISSIVCITMTELMVATSKGHVLRYQWDGSQNRDYNLDLRRVPFCINQQVSKAIPIVEENTYIVEMEYSPLLGGFAIALNDGRAAFLTASSLKFDPNQTQGIWAQGIEDATCASVNHKYRLLTFGRANSQCVVYYIDESTGGLELSHHCILSSKDYPGCPGVVNQVKWTPDGYAMAASWARGGIALWSTFGALLMCSLGWDYGLHVDLERCNPLHVSSMEWATEGYQLWMIRKHTYRNSTENDQKDVNSNSDEEDTYNVIQLDFVKSALTSNPCMSHQSHLFLQGDDRLYINTACTLIKLFSDRLVKDDGLFTENGTISASSTLAEGRQWLVIPIPSTYSATNWPIRYAGIDHDGQNVAIAGRTGLAHYSMLTRRWKLFGNETQEKDFVVTGGILWWRDYVVVGCYSMIDNRDEIRCYPKESKLDNKFAKIIKVSSPVLLINSLLDNLITFGSDGQVVIWSLSKLDTGNVEAARLQIIDISALCVHPACVTSVTLTSLRTEASRGHSRNSESIVLNVSGRLLLVQRESRSGDRSTCTMPTVLASCVESVWVPLRSKAEKVHLTEALWLFCGSHGMRVWLPLFPKDGDKTHTFMSKRIMLPFSLRIYPLAILFEDAIILGAENDTVLYTSDCNSPFSLPFSVLQRTSQVYLHQILRQLIRRNLGLHAWEIARSCNSLPYFPHSLELLLHEVLEEEATSKDPIPDAQLPSVIEFIMEFPVYLQTVVQCARKTEIALWPYLFSVAGKPTELFQQCMAKRQLDTAASYLIILQNLETSSVSRQYATLLLDTALEQSKWELAKELVRFLRAIDPNDVESPRTSFILPGKLALSAQSPPVTPDADDLTFILGSFQGPRGRRFSMSAKIAETKAINSVSDASTVIRRKKNSSVSRNSESRDGTAEEFFIDVILQRHARRLLSAHRLTDLGYFAAHLDFHLVTWLVKERGRAARIDDFVAALKHLHDEFNWPYPVATDLTNITGPPSTPTTPESPTLDDRIKTLYMDPQNNMQVTSSRVGDSGYVSFPGGLPCTGILTSQNLERSSQRAKSEIEEESMATQTEIINTSEDNYMVKHDPNGDVLNSPYLYDSKLGLLDRNVNLESSQLLDGIKNVPSNVVETVQSSVTSVFDDDADRDSISCNEHWEVPTAQVLEQLSNSGVKGSQRADVQLRYLLQLFMEASCLEWSLLISILLRDAMAVLRTVNAARTSEQSIEAISRLRQGLQLLCYWTYRECLGYKTFMLAIQNQISVLTKILATKIQQQQIQEHQQAVSATFTKHMAPIPSRSRKSSSNQDSTSQSGTVKEKRVNSSTSHSANERLAEVPQTDLEDAFIDDSSVDPASTGCIVL
ncbi:guanine nucleotide exchange factor subunit Rich isoform X2 [Photinus pyralis]|uniref:guanine nucleotide exchange factor subunit Rich isoform X2 n=1 Tax=Photinus pyralis TaxID=7054 RepID=UPI00126777CB|nr:guanine nucleotide exchange factor subunit Rich isoform X2 [Photinus pyralis]